MLKVQNNRLFINITKLKLKSLKYLWFKFYNIYDVKVIC